MSASSRPCRELSRAPLRKNTLTCGFILLCRELWIQAAKATLERITGREIPLFRPPHRSRDERVFAAAHAAEQWLVHWTVSVNDGRSTAAEIPRGVRERLSPNGIILLHELPQTIEALPAIIRQARKAGHRFVALPRGRPLVEPPRVGSYTVRRLWSASSHHTAGQVLSAHETRRDMRCTSMRSSAQPKPLPSRTPQQRARSRSRRRRQGSQLPCRPTWNGCGPTASS